MTEEYHGTVFVGVVVVPATLWRGWRGWAGFVAAGAVEATAYMPAWAVKNAPLMIMN